MKKFNELPLEVRLNIMSFNSEDISNDKYNKILNHPFPPFKTVIDNMFIKPSMYFDNTFDKSDYEIYMICKAIYDYSYINMVLLNFKQNIYCEYKKKGCNDEDIECIKFGYCQVFKKIFN